MYAMLTKISVETKHAQITYRDYNRGKKTYEAACQPFLIYQNCSTWANMEFLVFAICSFILNYIYNLLPKKKEKLISSEKVIYHRNNYMRLYFRNSVFLLSNLTSIDKIKRGSMMILNAGKLKTDFITSFFQLKK